jgi:glyoxylase-like metal-dependent hydrolase (beta-lactamase superfamily II)
VARALREGDEVAGFEVLDVPGHTNGHIALWRESDRVLIAGDVIWNLDFALGRPGLTVPFAAANSDTSALRKSIRRIAELEPALVLFGHGPPLRDPVKLARFAGVG